MSPKKAQQTPQRRRSREAVPASADSVTPVSEFSSSSSASSTSQPTSPRTPPNLSTTRIPSSVYLGTHSETTSIASTVKTTAGVPVSCSTQWPRWIIAALGVVLVALTMMIFINSSGNNGSSRGAPHHPCVCATAVSATNPLAKVALSRRSGVSGVHWHQSSNGNNNEGYDRLAFASNCSGLSLENLHGTFTSVAQLREALQKPFDQRSNRCVMWVTTPEAVQEIANALKELLENNALGGTAVVPPQACGVLVVKSTHSREELKNVLPHRVVHMLSSVT